MRTTRFKTGDVVRAKSGGMNMTVRETLGTSIVCDWFDHESQPHQGRFSVESLVLAKAQEGQLSWAICPRCRAYATKV